MTLEYRIRFACCCDNSIIADELFSDLSPESLRVLKKIKQTKTFDKNSSVCAIGDSPKGIYIFTKGEAELSVYTEYNKIEIVGSIKPKVVIGLTEVLANTSYRINVVTTKSSVFEFIQYDDLIKFLRGEPVVCLHLVKLLCRHLQKAMYPLTET